MISHFQLYLTSSYSCVQGRLSANGKVGGVYSQHYLEGYVYVSPSQRSYTLTALAAHQNQLALPILSVTSINQFFPEFLAQNLCMKTTMGTSRSYAANS